MYDKIKSETRAAFLTLYPHGTLEDLTGAIIRHIALSPDVFFHGGISIYEALIIAEEIDFEMSEIAIAEMEVIKDEK